MYYQESFLLGAPPEHPTHHVRLILVYCFPAFSRILSDGRKAFTWNRVVQRPELLHV